MTRKALQKSTLFLILSGLLSVSNPLLGETTKFRPNVKENPAECKMAPQKSDKKILECRLNHLLNGAKHQEASLKNIKLKKLQVRFQQKGHQEDSFDNTVILKEPRLSAHIKTKDIRINKTGLQVDVELSNIEIGIPSAEVKTQALHPMVSFPAWDKKCQKLNVELPVDTTHNVTILFDLVSNDKNWKVMPTDIQLVLDNQVQIIGPNTCTLRGQKVKTPTMMGFAAYEIKTAIPKLLPKMEDEVKNAVKNEIQALIQSVEERLNTTSLFDDQCACNGLAPN